MFVFLMQPDQTVAKKIRLFFVAIFTAVAFLFISGSTVAARVINPGTVDVFSAISRVGAWIQAVNDFRSSPLLGVGTGGFELDLFWLTFTYPHNLFLEFASENGIIGVFFIVMFIILAIKYGITNVNHYHKIKLNLPMQLSITSMAIFLYALWNSMFSGDIPNNEIVWFGAGLIWVLHISIPLQK